MLIYNKKNYVTHCMLPNLTISYIKKLKINKIKRNYVAKEARIYNAERQSFQ